MTISHMVQGHFRCIHTSKALSDKMSHRNCCIIIDEEAEGLLPHGKAATNDGSSERNRHRSSSKAGPIPIRRAHRLCISRMIVFPFFTFIAILIGLIFLYKSPDWLNDLSLAGSANERSSKGYVPYDKIFGYVHMAKTAGTEMNGELAAHFERICGNKGYSYDAFQFNQRVKLANSTNTRNVGAGDLISLQYQNYNRGRVPTRIMDEIGFENCDVVFLEVEWQRWKSISSVWPLELHVPCRNPLEHLMSQCNFRRKTFHCEADNLEDEVKGCLVEINNRFHKNLAAHSNATLKCFNPIPMDPYLEYMSQYLQRKRIETEYVHRDTNPPRNKTKECIWTNRTAADRVLEILLRYDYYSFCEECMGSEDDLLVEKGVFQ